MGLFKKLFGVFTNKNKDKQLQVEKEKEELKAKIEALEKKLETTKQVEINNLKIYEDKEKKALEFEINQLEEELQNLSEEKNEHINKLNHFNTRYTLELGELIERLLELKKELLHLHITKSDDVDEEIHKEYEEIEEEYKNFHNDYEETIKIEKDRGIISDEELKELKAVFRKAVKICHPDIVEDKHKEKAHKIMLKLNDAYQRKILDEVVAIFESLGTDFSGSETISDIEHLKQKIKYLKKAIEDTNIEIEEIVKSEEYLVLSEIESLDEYIEEIKLEFENEIKRVEDELLLFETFKEELENDLFEMEESIYSQQLRAIKNITFEKIRKVSKKYIMSMGDTDYLHYQLNQGVTIIEEQDLLYKYLFNYGKMHKAKLYSSFDEVIYQLNNQTINIIDWGCGQALATFLLIDYIKEKNLKINISNITLIEPSQLALSRGLLHIDVLTENPIKIRAINKDIDSLEHSDLIIDNSHITLHLFSNILDVEFFRLDRFFLEKISNSQNGLNYFICVSPNINDKRNARLDMFYRYFRDNFDTELISNRDNNIGKYARYEKIFRVLNL